MGHDVLIFPIFQIAIKGNVFTTNLKQQTHFEKTAFYINMTECCNSCIWLGIPSHSLQPLVDKVREKTVV